MKLNVLFFLLVIFISSCQKELSPENITGYDVFLVAGQSNTLAGAYKDSLLDQTDYRVWQLGRAGADNGKYIPATEPLQNTTPEAGRIGFATTFAKLYANNLLKKDRWVLLIPCGASATSFALRNWNKGDPLYNDAVQRVNKVLSDTANKNVLKGILWHQGESDAYFGIEYSAKLDDFINDIRQDIKAPGMDSIPFIAGGLVPYYADQFPSFLVIDSILRNLPFRILQTGFADSRIPTVIRKPDNTVDPIHFGAAGQREMGKRYFAEYKRLVN